VSSHSFANDITGHSSRNGPVIMRRTGFLVEQFCLQLLHGNGSFSQSGGEAVFSRAFVSWFLSVSELDGFFLLSKALIFAFAFDSNSCREIGSLLDLCGENSELPFSTVFFSPAGSSATLPSFEKNEHYSAASKSMAAA
jgi:hypothetical protein